MAYVALVFVMVAFIVVGSNVYYIPTVYMLEGDFYKYAKHFEYIQAYSPAIVRNCR